MHSIRVVSIGVATLVGAVASGGTAHADADAGPDAAQLFGGTAPQVKETVLYNFSGPDGNGPLGPLVAATSGGVVTLYGVTAGGGSLTGGCSTGGCGVVFALAKPQAGQTAWAEALPVEFTQGNGSVPSVGLLGQPLAGGGLALFGTTLYGGPGSTPAGYNTGDGTVFSLVGDNLTKLWDFSGGDDGSHPSAVLTTDDAAGVPGALYSSARNGGSGNAGTVFQLQPSTGTLTPIWSFTGKNGDGKEPTNALVADSTGALYGMTFKAGASGAGIVYKLIPPATGDAGAADGGDAGPTWTEQIVWSFTGNEDGQNPEQQEALVMDESGALYGTAVTGGAFTNSICPVGCGVVFKLTPPAAGQTAWTEQTLWSFTGAGDGAFPQGGLIVDKTGALYGTVNGGGSPNCVGAGIGAGCGVVYKLTPPSAGQTDWTLTTLLAFAGPPTDGANPYGALTADDNGTLYGTTQLGTSSASALLSDSGAEGGANPWCSGAGVTPGCGTVFELTGTGFVSSATPALDAGTAPSDGGAGEDATVVAIADAGDATAATQDGAVASGDASTGVVGASEDGGEDASAGSGGAGSGGSSSCGCAVPGGAASGGVWADLSVLLGLALARRKKQHTLHAAREEREMLHAARDPK